MKLYYSPGACSLASHIVLQEAGKPFEIEKVDLRAKTYGNGADFRAVNAKGAVPALQVDARNVLTEGVAIMQFVASEAGAEHLVGKAGTLERARVQEALNYISSEIHKSYSPLFNPALDEAGKIKARETVSQKYGWLDAMLADGRPYLMGEAFTVADAYLYTVTSWAKGTGIDLGRLPHIAAHFMRVGGRDAVKAARKAEGLPV